MNEHSYNHQFIERKKLTITKTTEKNEINAKIDAISLIEKIENIDSRIKDVKYDLRQINEFINERFVGDISEWNEDTRRLHQSQLTKRKVTRGELEKLCSIRDLLIIEARNLKLNSKLLIDKDKKIAKLKCKTAEARIEEANIISNRKLLIEEEKTKRAIKISEIESSLKERFAKGIISDFFKIRDGIQQGYLNTDAILVIVNNAISNFEIHREEVRAINYP